MKSKKDHWAYRFAVWRWTPIVSGVLCGLAAWSLGLAFGAASVLVLSLGQLALGQYGVLKNLELGKLEN